MIRMFPKRVGQLLALVAALRRYVPSEWHVGSAAYEVYHNSSSSPVSDWDSQKLDQFNRLLKRIYNEDKTPLDEVLTELLNLYHKSRSDVEPSDLIDEMVHILQMPRGQWVMSSQAYRQLQQAILIPDELREFKKTVRSSAGCAGCGRSITSGEMTSITFDNDGTPILFCLRCRHPNTVPCARCGEQVSFRQWNPQNEYLCPAHNPKTAKQAQAPATASPAAAPTPPTPTVTGRIFTDRLFQERIPVPPPQWITETANFANEQQGFAVTISPDFTATIPPATTRAGRGNPIVTWDQLEEAVRDANAGTATPTDPNRAERPR